jgi:hypothetical protein
MPIVVAVLGVVLVALGVAFFTISPKESITLDTADANRTEAMEVEAEAEIIPNPVAVPEPAIAIDDVPQLAVVSETKPTTPLATITLSGASTYKTPARVTHDIEVTLTLLGDVVKDVTVNYDKGAGVANGYQERFDATYRTLVVGKKIGDISLSRVGGASITSGGFNDSVAKIKAQM